jgi:hypothetical protein
VTGVTPQALKTLRFHQYEPNTVLRSPRISESLPVCFFSFACIFQPVASFAGSSGLRRPEKWALMACFSHAAEVCYT